MKKRVLLALYSGLILSHTGLFGMRQVTCGQKQTQIAASHCAPESSCCEFETGIPAHVARIIQAFGKKYKHNELVQAILNQDIAALEKFSQLNKPNGRFKVEVYEGKDFKAVCECNHIGLALGVALNNSMQKSLEKKHFTKQDAEQLYKVIVALKNKGAVLDSTYSWTPYELKNNTWVIALSSKTCEPNKKLAQAFAQECGMLELTQLFT